MSWRLKPLAGVALLAGLLGIASSTTTTSRAEAASEEAGSPPMIRRLTQDQYKNIVRDTFGAEITFGARMDPDFRLEGLVALGSGQATVTAVGFEQYDSLARSIAAQVMEPRRRAGLFSCDPGVGGKLDAVCTDSILRQAGRALQRRPLSEAQAKEYLAVAAEAAASIGDPYKAVEYGLATILVSPSFLFQREIVEPDPRGRRGAVRLDAYSKAARLSFLLWDSGPDERLLAAADSGEIHKPAVLRSHVARMTASPRLEGGVRAFFKDYLQLTMFEAVGKDSVLYPKFSQTVANDAPEQLLRTIVQQLVKGDGDYRKLFTTRETYMSRALGVVYQVPVQSEEYWAPYTFPENDPRAGILSQIAFTALYAHPGRSSPTLRGKAIREILMCQTVPLPPANVDFSQFEAASSAGKTTARDRLNAHTSNPVCAGCHKITDPLGLALEKFDGLGAYREREDDLPIDTTGALEGVAFDGVAGLAKTLHDSRHVSNCVVQQLFAYGTGQKIDKTQSAWVSDLQKTFAGENYNFPSLIRRIALSEEFYRVQAAPPDMSASLPSNTTN